jgi:hypothetical protein
VDLKETKKTKKLIIFWLSRIPFHGYEIQDAGMKEGGGSACPLMPPLR